MKVAIITDTHFGGRASNKNLVTHQKNFFKNVFFPELEKQGIDTVLHMGDLFDVRKYISYQILHDTKEMFLDVLKEKNITMHIIAGNHDTSYKNTNKINSLDLLLKEYTNINVYSDDIKLLNYGNIRFAMVPWINQENNDKIMSELKTIKVDYVLGHFEIIGFKMSGGEKCKHGLDENIFTNFEKVLSGHFHVPSKKSNIHYIGAPYQMDWSDYGGERGFYILDCETKDMRFVKNPNNLFNIIEYDDTDATLEDLEDLNQELFENTFIKINPTKVENVALFEKFVSKIECFNAADIKIVEIPSKKKVEETEEVSTTDIEEADTIKFVSNFIEKMDVSEEFKEAIKEKFIELYNRCKGDSI